MTHFEETLQRDVERIRSKVREMAALAEASLNSCRSALVQRTRQLAYSVILRDTRIDELDTDIDRLCLEVILRQQPVAYRGENRCLCIGSGRCNPVGRMVATIRQGRCARNTANYRRHPLQGPD